MTETMTAPAKFEILTINGCRVKVTYSSDGDGMKPLHTMIQDTLRQKIQERHR